MNVSELAHRAYAPGASAAVRTGRSVELQLFGQITSALKAAADRQDPIALATAIHDNRRLWTLLAVDVADRDNNLPQSLRAQIFYLSEFTAHHSGRVLRGDVPVDALVDVNRAMMAGLAGQAGGA